MDICVAEYLPRLVINNVFDVLNTVDMACMIGPTDFDLQVTGPGVEVRFTEQALSSRWWTAYGNGTRRISTDPYSI